MSQRNLEFGMTAIVVACRSSVQSERAGRLFLLGGDAPPYFVV